MPDRRPLDALQKATSIGADPLSRDNFLLGEMPLSPEDLNILKSLGKPISELLGTVLKPTATGTGLPARMRLGSFDSSTGKALVYGARKGNESFEASLPELDSLINGGAVDVAQPPKGAVARIQNMLKSLLGSPDNVPPAPGSPMTPDRLERALQSINDRVPVDPETGMKIYNPPGAPRVSPQMAEDALQRMVDATPKGPNGQPITNPAGHMVDDIMDLPIMRGSGPKRVPLK